MVSSLPWGSWVLYFVALWTLCSVCTMLAFQISSFIFGKCQWVGLCLAVIIKCNIFPLHSWKDMLKPSNDMLQWWMHPQWIQVRPRQRLLRWNWRERLPWVPFSLCGALGFTFCPFGILINLLDLLMDRNAYNMPLVIEISWQIFLWIRGDELIRSLFLPRHSEYVLP